MQAARLKGSLGLPGTSLGFNCDFLANCSVPKAYSKVHNFHHGILRNVVADDQGLLRASVGLSGLLWVSGPHWVSLALSGFVSWLLWASLGSSGFFWVSPGLSQWICLGSIGLSGPLWDSLWAIF